MIDRLQSDQFEQVRSLSQASHMQFVMEAMIAGNTPARVWVDDAGAPVDFCLGRRRVLLFGW